MSAACTAVPGKKSFARFGVEAPRALIWKGWEPGREYTKPLILKNIEFKTQKLKFRLPSHSFSTEYPQCITLSAGTSYVLPITFRPLEKKEYDEFIEFHAAGRTFAVPFKAQLPTPHISLPESVVFGMCGVQDSMSVQINMTNTGDTPTEFRWDVPPPFDIQPSSGTIAVKQSCKLSAVFSPNIANAYEVDAVCTYGSEQKYHKSIKLEGVGKYPCVRAEVVSKKPAKKPAVSGPAHHPAGGVCPAELQVNFGQVAVGSSKDCTIEIINVAPVAGHFALLPLPQGDLQDRVFASSLSTGSILPQGSQRVKLTFTPHTVGLTSVEYFDLVTQGAVNKTRIKCIGSCSGPCASLREECLNFGSIECNQSSSSLLHIRNDSSVPVVFKICLDASSVFSPGMLCGCVGGGMVQSVPFTFTPPRPMGYHRRATILLQHHPPLFIDLVGNAFTETVKPALVLPKHLKMFTERVKDGLSRYSPEQIQQLMSQGSVVINGEGRVVSSDPAPVDCRVSESPYERVLEEETGLDAGALPHVSSDVQEVQFDYCKERETSESKVVNVCNHTEGKMMCIWSCGADSLFQVMPEERELQPGKTVSFSVSFKPKRPSQFYVREVECFVFYKSLRDHRQVQDHSISPPWCLTVKLFGHSFAPGTEVYTPKITLDYRNLLMPPCEAHQSVYKTVTVKNSGESAVLYHFRPDPTGIVTIKPESGLLQDEYQVFIVRMRPVENKTYKHVLPLDLNLTDKFAQNILISGKSEVPSVRLENEGHVYFRATCASGHSSVLYKVHNTSRLPLSYQWRLSEGSYGVVSVSPSSGLIHPHETQHHRWTFHPREPRVYEMLATLHLSTYQQPRSKHHKEPLVLLGQGCVGHLLCEPSTVDFGTTVIGTSSSRKLTLSNPNPCNLHYRLTTEGAIREDGRATVRMAGSSPGLQLSTAEGILPGGSQAVVTATVRPGRACSVHMDINYTLQLSQDTPQEECEERRLCSVDVRGVYPSLTVVDIQGEGSAALHSKTTLWTMLSMDTLIHCLKDEPSVQELRYAVATRHSTRRRVKVKTRASVGFDFGITPVGSAPSVVHLMLANDGPAPTNWAFQFPEDMYLEPEYWADTADLDETEKHELHLTSHKIFQVQPKSGTLKPAEHAKVTLSCSHAQVLKAKLPILLKINRGREILINFLSETINTEASLVYLPTEHTFAPVPIGSTVPPKQTLTLYNGGNIDVGYTIQTSPLAALKKENFGMDILECLQSEGIIRSHESVDIEFVFSPLEAKRYMVDLKVMLSNGQFSQVTFIGDGVLPSSEDTPRGDESWLPVQQNCSHTPHCRVIHLAGQLAKLSKEILVLGHVPLFTTATEVIHLTNTSPHTVSFQWDLGETPARILSVEPSSGYLQPSCSVLCRLVLYSTGSPAYHNMDVLCKIQDETKYAVFRDEVEKWEREQEEEQHLFTISDKRSFRGRPQTTPSTSSTPKNMMISSHHSELDIKKYQALPPIRLKTAGSTTEYYEDWKKKDMSVRSKARPRAKRMVETVYPVPPSPYVLHLGVVVRTHSIADHTRLLPSTDSLHLDSHILSHNLLTSPGDTTVTDCERDLLEDVMTLLVRDSLADKDFASSVQRMAAEPMPFFSQFAVSTSAPHHGGQTAAKHLYAAALTRIPCGSGRGGGDLPGGVGTNRAPPPDRTTSFSVSEAVDIEGSEASSSRHSPIGPNRNLSLPYPPKEVLEEEEALKHLPEFHHLARSILENTMVNLLKEVTCGELDLRRSVKMVLPGATLQSPPKSLS